MSRTAGRGETEVKSFCRICTGHCGVIASVDENRRLVAIRGDKDDPQTLGFVCSKGTDAVDSHNSGERLLRPLKRMPDGSFEPIPLERAIGEIADRLGDIIHRNGPGAVASYRGSGGFFASATLNVLDALMAAIGSPKKFSNLTIDQSAKVVAMGRLGVWPPGPQPFHDSDVCMLLGNNPLVSIAAAAFDTRHPLKRIKEARARGMKLIVVDPRRTETAEYADVFLQPLPGYDAAILAAIIRIILDEGWQDADFCRQHVGDLDCLRRAVEPFTPEKVAEAADIPADGLWEAARVFARDGRRGIAGTGTGPSMSPHSNLMEHLVGCLNVICGRFIREGEPIDNPGFLMGRTPKPAQVVDIGRSWESGPRSRIGGYGTVGGEMLTGLLADEILQPGEGQVKCLINHGGNPAASVPDHRKIARALESLELFVSIEPVMTASAALSDYILPPRMPYERADLHLSLFETAIYPFSYARYTPALADPPPGSEVCDEWYVLWSLASRLGYTLTCNGIELDRDEPPTEEQLLEILTANAPVPLAQIKRHPEGYLDRGEPMVAAPADPATAAKFTTMPDDVAGEMEGLLGDMRDADRGGRGFDFRLCSRRNRHRFNTVGHLSPYLKKLTPRNPAYLNPDDLRALGVATGDWVEISSDNGAIRATVAEDETVRRGVVSMTHCFGYLPDTDDFIEHGVSTNLLISTDRDLQTINAMPRMSGIPVNIEPLM